MQTPEEFARLIEQMSTAAQAMGERITDTYRLADLIRERDAAVRAEALAGFTDAIESARAEWSGDHRAWQAIDTVVEKFTEPEP